MRCYLLHKDYKHSRDKYRVLIIKVLFHARITSQGQEYFLVKIKRTLNFEMIIFT